MTRPNNQRLLETAEGRPVSRIGIGTWAIGGPFFSGEGCHYPTGAPLGYGTVDDRESTRALQCAAEMGVTLFDTSDAYGTGHGERILGSALRHCRERVFIATKFGNCYDETTKQLTGADVSPAYINWACRESLKRLGTDWIDLYQLHLGDLPPEQAIGAVDTLEDLRAKGLIRAYGWSTDAPDRATAFAQNSAAAAIQFDLNLFDDAPAMLSACEKHGLTAICRNPLAMGFLTGKFSAHSKLATNDFRAQPPRWLRYFEEGGAASTTWTNRLDSITEILTSNGRTRAQGALAWILARGEGAIPIPGVRTAAQAEENIKALELGALQPDQMREIDRLLDRDGSRDD